MPKTIGKYKCNHCDDIIEGTSEEYRECGCGKSKIQLSTFGHSYYDGTSVERISSNTYYEESEFVYSEEVLKLVEEAEVLVNKYNDDPNGRSYYFYKYHESGKGGEELLSSLSISCSECCTRYSMESNEISVKINFRKETNYNYSYTLERESRLKKFIELMKKIETGEIDLKNRSQMVSYSEEEQISYDEEPTGEVDYKFNI